MELVVGVIVSLLKSYLVKLASKEFIEFVIMEVADSAVKSTKTEADDKWLAEIKKVVKG